MNEDAVMVNFTLPKQMDDTISKIVAHGLHSSKSEFIREAIRRAIDEALPRINALKTFSA